MVEVLCVSLCIWHIRVVQKLLKYLISKHLVGSHALRYILKRRRRFSSKAELCWNWAVLNANKNYFLQRKTRAAHCTTDTEQQSFSLDFFRCFYFFVNLLDFFLTFGFLTDLFLLLPENVFQIKSRGCTLHSWQWATVIWVFWGWLYFLHL